MWWSFLNIRRIVGARYVLLRYHGNGLNGVVFRAVARQSRQPVAIKLIRVEPRDSITRKRVPAEIEAMKRLEGKLSVKIYEANPAATPLYYVMELVRWGDFRSLLERRISVPRLLSIFHGICRCVADCHALDITHRDIKPENILFRSPNRPILGDFGICKLGAAVLGTTRVEMEKRGTPLYMAPEQLRDIFPKANQRTFML